MKKHTLYLALLFTLPTLSQAQYAGGSGRGEIVGSSPADSPLPISLLSFTNFCKSDNNVLNWTTATETNNDYFTIEKSTDAKEWTAIGNIKGAGNSNEFKSYSYSDKASASIVYYRLKQTDFDGKYSYSEIISSKPCNQSEASVISIYPNPLNDNVTISFNSVVEENVTIEVVSEKGDKVFTKDIKVINGKSFIELDLSHLAKGTYLLYFSNFPTESHKIVKR